MFNHKAAERISSTEILIRHPNGLTATLFATEDVYIDPASVNEALDFLGLADTLEQSKKLLPYGTTPEIEKIILTPDFHRGAGIPVGTVFQAKGFVLPKAIGNDIGCGMRFLTTNIDRHLIDNALNLEDILRAIFFEGQRNISLSREARNDIFKWGLAALEMHGKTNISMTQKSHEGGGFPTETVIKDFLESSALDDKEETFDAFLGSIGGGNHFVEIQVIDEILDPETAYAWGLYKGKVTIMCHSGSLGVGHWIGNLFAEKAKAFWPKTLKYPTGGYYPLCGEEAQRYIEHQKAGVNFAFANRFFLGQSALTGLERALNQKIEAQLLQDAPHNACWQNGENRFLHRKGACPAPGPDSTFTEGHPVIVPGSMGDSSWILKGQGALHSLCSACHGAGRIAKRGSARKGSYEELERLRVVTPWNHKSLEAKKRPDILAAHAARLLEEAPSAYKDVLPAAQTCEQAGIAKPVAILKPLLTVKG